MFFFIEIAGTVAFACSGAMVAIKKHLDLLGVIVLGVITAVGGGLIRDLIIGITPPTLFVKPVYVTAAFLASLALFLAVKYVRGGMESVAQPWYETVLNLTDAIGLGAFTATGIDKGISAGFEEYHFLIIFLGVITGVGGGILRDIMAGQTPYILKKHVYASASIAGALFCVLLLDLNVSVNMAMLASAAVVVGVRLLAWHFKWNLPRV